MSEVSAPTAGGVPDREAVTVADREPGRWRFRVRVACQGVAVDIVTNEKALHNAVAGHLAAFGPAGNAAAHCLAVHRLDNGTCRLRCDGDRPVEGSWDRVLHCLRERLVSHWMSTPPDRMWLHASGVCDDEGATLFAGPPGCGKSALAAACVRRGLRYLGDDALPVDCRAGAVWPVPFAPALRRGYDRWMTSGEFLAQQRTYRLDMLQRASAEPVPVRRIVFPVYEPGVVRPRLEPLSTISAAAALAPQVLNRNRLPGEEPIADLIDWIRRTPHAYCSRYADVEALAAMLV